jgi:hypothetical protein
MFNDLVRRVPDVEADTAAGTVLSDRQGYEALKLDGKPPSRGVALAYLLNKLLLFSRVEGLVPIVGQGYASDMVAWKVRSTGRDPRRQLPGRPQDPQQARTTYAAFAAGLSFAFVDDAELSQAPIESLLRFKTEHRDLLHRSQRHILDTAQRFGGLADDKSFVVEVERLRQDVRIEQRVLEEEARSGLRDAGLKLAGKGIAAGATVLTGGLLLAAHPMSAMVAALSAAIAAAIPEVLAKASDAVPEGVALAKKTKRAWDGDLAYLFRVGEKFSLEAALGLPRR